MSEMVNLVIVGAEGRPIHRRRTRAAPRKRFEIECRLSAAECARKGREQGAWSKWYGRYASAADRDKAVTQLRKTRPYYEWRAFALLPTSAAPGDGPERLHEGPASTEHPSPTREVPKVGGER